MFCLNFYQIAYIAKLSFFLTVSPSSLQSPRAESNTESEIFTNTLHFNFFVKNESISDLNVNN